LGNARPRILPVQRRSEPAKTLSPESRKEIVRLSLMTWLE
jgi:hypothetical protein